MYPYNVILTKTAGKSYERHWVWTLVVAFLCLLAASCSRTVAPAPELPGPQSSEIRKEYRKGPVHVTVTLDKDTPTIAQDLTLTIEAEAARDYEVQLPAFGDKLGEFGIVDYRQDPPVLAGGDRVVTRKIYRLEPFLSGDYTIAPMTVTFHKKFDPAGGKDDPTPEENAVTTDEIHVKVRSLLGEDRKDLRLHPIFGPVDLPAARISVIYVCLGLAVLLLGGAGLYYWSRRRTNGAEQAALAPPAHELAYAQLREILDGDLLERGEFKLFFARISDVVRYYIENRFGLHAPRLTTEEFLAAIGRDPLFREDFRSLLDEFLRHCDLVKFAEHRPRTDEAQKAIDACRAFIEATKVIES